MKLLLTGLAWMVLNFGLGCTTMGRGSLLVSCQPRSPRAY